mgnify:CR=1 FL=1
MYVVCRASNTRVVSVHVSAMCLCRVGPASTCFWLAACHAHSWCRCLCHDMRDTRPHMHTHDPRLGCFTPRCKCGNDHAHAGWCLGAFWCRGRGTLVFAGPYCVWDQSPFNIANGGNLKQPQEFFTNPTSRALYKWVDCVGCMHLARCMSTLPIVCSRAIVCACVHVYMYVCVWWRGMWCNILGQTKAAVPGVTLCLEHVSVCVGILQRSE